MGLHLGYSKQAKFSTSFGFGFLANTSQGFEEHFQQLSGQTTILSYFYHFCQHFYTFFTDTLSIGTSFTRLKAVVTAVVVVRLRAPKPL